MLYQVKTLHNILKMDVDMLVTFVDNLFVNEL